MVRGVVLPYTRGGLIAAVLLGCGRALGEAIAVTQVIGTTAHLTSDLFDTGDTLASRIAAQYQGAASNLQVASLVYLGVILLVISLITNFAAQLIVQRFDVAEGPLMEAPSIPDLAEGDRPVPAAPAGQSGGEGIAAARALARGRRARARRHLRVPARHPGAEPRLLHQEAGDVR